MARVERPEIGTEMYAVFEHLYSAQNRAGPLLEYCVCKGTVRGFSTGGYTNEGQTVLDCCMGSGSIGVACKQTGRNYIGIDNDPHWVNVATQRIGQISQ